MQGSRKAARRMLLRLRFHFAHTFRSSPQNQVGTCAHEDAIKMGANGHNTMLTERESHNGCPTFAKLRWDQSLLAAEDVCSRNPTLSARARQRWGTRYPAS